MIKKNTDCDTHPKALSWRILIVVLSGFLAAWISAGSIGLLAHPLRRILTVLALGIVIFTLPLSVNRRHDITWRALGIVIAIWMTASSFLPINILAVAFLLACLGVAFSGSYQDKFAVLLASGSVAILAMYRLACVTIPTVWLVADRAGRFMGLLASNLTGKPLWVGSTFGGLDFLVLIVAFFGSWLLYTRVFRLKTILFGIAAILAGHFTYLILLSISSATIHILPKENSAVGLAKYLTIFTLWILPQLAGWIHLAVAGFMIKHLSWPQKEFSFKVGKLNPRWSAISLTFTFLILALLLAILINLYSPLGNLKGRKIVVYEHGFLNWLKPRHGDYGRLSIGMYGMMSAHIQSLGGHCVISPDLSKSDLSGAQMLLLLYPNDPWPEGVLDRIWKFVEEGGSLLVMGEHTVKEPDGGNRFNDVLAPTNMRVRFDSATFAVGGWLQSYQSMSHPAFIGITDDRNQFGVVIGASVEAQWPARPLLMGRWGWADPGDLNTSAMMGNGVYDPGEKLGDIILAAEQRFGKGRIIVFGDTSSLTNGILIDDHPFVYRLFSYLANQGSDYHQTWRQLAAFLVVVFLVLILVYLPGNMKAFCILGLAIALTVCRGLSVRTNNLVPDGRLKKPNNLAYIDSSHLPVFSEESWRDDGTMGLALNLMRNGYLTISLPELTEQRLEGTGLLVLIAPTRSFTGKERNIIYKFVDQGGILLCMAGYEDRQPIRPLLSDFGFDIGLPGYDSAGAPREPQPLGHYKAPYLNTGEYMSYVRFHAAWPIFCNDPEARIMAYGRDDVPVIICRKVGQGKIVVIGDTCFAMNKNLEYQNGAPFEGMRENAHFWRWFITDLRDEPMWVPPNEYAAIKGVK